MSSFIILMFFILTLAVETPLIKILYRKVGDGLSWLRTIQISFGINLISYLFVLIFPFILLFAYSIYGSIADTVNIKKWNDISLLNNESGYIYTIEHNNSGKYVKYVLKQYDIGMRKWETIEPTGGWERGIDYSVWDVRDNILACIIETEGWKNRSLSILNKSTYIPIVKITGNFQKIRISPDIKKVAALEFVREAVAPKDREGSFSLGSACRLRIYDTYTGKLLYEAPRWSLNEGLSWDKDSKAVFFASLKDEHLFDNNIDKLPHSHIDGRGYAKKGQFPIDIFVFDLASNSVKNIIEGKDPRIIVSTDEITFLREKEIYVNELWRLNLKTGKTSLVLSEINSDHHDVSPSGKRFLIPVRRNQILGEDKFLTVTDSADTNHKYILQTSSSYDFRWVPKTTE